MRCPRDYFTKGNIFHIYNHSVSDEKLFREDSDYILLLRRFKQSMDKTDVSIIAYCLMPDHFHFLIRQDSDLPIYSLFNSVFSSYVQNFNKRHKRRGRLFQSHLQHILVDSDQYLIYLCQYIHYNPVKAGLVANAEDWPYSNYLEWIGRRNGKLFNPEMRDAYFSSPEDYMNSLNEHEEYLDDLPFMRLAFRMEKKKV